MATSGTVTGYPFNLRKVMDHAFRRARLTPQMNSAENLALAQDLVFLLTSEWINAGFPLWTRQFGLLGLQIGSPDVACAPGTVDVFHAYWRILNPWRGAALTGAGADASRLFTGQPGTDLVIAGPNPAVVVNFGSATQLDTIGVLLGGGAAITTALEVWTAPDGVTWTLSQTLPATTFSPGRWAYFDLTPSTLTQYVKLTYVAAGSWTLNALNFGLSNGVDTEIGVLNIDDYWNLPTKAFTGNQPNSAYVDRQLAGPVLKVWPVPSVAAFYAGTVAVLSRRYIENPGQLTNDVEVPQRWLEALIARLAVKLDAEIERPPAQNQLELVEREKLTERLEPAATKAEALAWSEERTRAPIRCTPDISPYTR